MVRRSFILFILLGLSLVTAQARNVDSTEAQMVAARFAYLNNIKGEPVLTKIIENEDQHIPAVYVFNMTEGGFVIVAGNDCVQPILGYSNKSALNLSHLPDGLSSYLKMRADETSYAQKKRLSPIPKTITQWEDLRQVTTHSKQKATNTKDAHSYLISSTWDQSWPYNMHCPEIDGNTAIVGCVATALSQIIRFWGYPEHGFGSTSYLCHSCGVRISEDFSETTYDYEHMPDILGYDSSNEEKEAVSTLCYHAGVSVWMQYGVSSSGVGMSNIGHYCTRALKNNFGFDTNTTRACYRSTMTSEQWVDTIRKEIEDGRPVFYCGYDNDSPGNDAGHAFILDGYDSVNSLFHVNWGWSGSGDGWFDLYNSELNVYGYHFSALQAALLGVQPQQPAPPEPPDPPDPPDPPEPVGIDKIDATEGIQLSVYPNPVSEYLTISYCIEAPAMLHIRSVTGQHIASIQLLPNEKRTTFDAAHLPSGIYYCTLNGRTCKFAVTR